MALRRNAFTYGVLVPFAIVLAFPFVWMAVTRHAASSISAPDHA